MSLKDEIEKKIQLERDYLETVDREKKLIEQERQEQESQEPKDPPNDRLQPIHPLLEELVASFDSILKEEKVLKIKSEYTDSYKEYRYEPFEQVNERSATITVQGTIKSWSIMPRRERRDNLIDKINLITCFIRLLLFIPIHILMKIFTSKSWEEIIETVHPNPKRPEWVMLDKPGFIVETGFDYRNFETKEEVINYLLEEIVAIVAKYRHKNQ